MASNYRSDSEFKAFKQACREFSKWTRATNSILTSQIQANTKLRDIAMFAPIWFRDRRSRQEFGLRVAKAVNPLLAPRERNPSALLPELIAFIELMRQTFCAADESGQTDTQAAQVR